jgi:trehalose-6-phosphate synthase
MCGLVQGQTIVLGIDVCQRLSGGALKFAAYDKLLSDYHDTAGKVVLLQVQ